MAHDRYIKVEDKYLPKYSEQACKELPPGRYEVGYIPDMGQYVFQEVEFNHDELLELPSPEFQTVANQIDTFLTTKSKELFKQYKYVYKRSILMHGVPGTGKTCLVNRIANKVVKDGGVVLFNPDPQLLPGAFKALNDIQPNINVVVVFEELDQLVRSHEHHLLGLLDGEIQRDNVIYLATTNYISKVPARIMRPGRFGSVVEIKYPDANARYFYLNEKMGKFTTQEEINHWVKNTEELSIDELKEVVLSTKCLKIKFEDVMTRIYETKELCKDDNVFDEYEEWREDGGRIGRAGMQNLAQQIEAQADAISNIVYSPTKGE